MYYTVYKIINNINGKYYIGKHQTKYLDDEYMGSGKLIKQAIKKYGKQNFKKQILFIYDNEQDMNEKEKQLVTISEETYNICLGGYGGCIVLYKQHELYEQICKKISDAAIKRKEKISKRAKELHLDKKIGMYNKKQSEYQKEKVSKIQKNKIISEEQKQKQKNSLRKLFESEGYIHPNKGKKRSIEQIQKQKATKLKMGYYESVNNPMFGVKHKEKSKEIMSEKAKNRIKITCEICNRIIDKSNYIRWHGEKCKSK